MSDIEKLDSIVDEIEQLGKILQAQLDAYQRRTKELVCQSYLDGVETMHSKAKIILSEGRKGNE